LVEEHAKVACCDHRPDNKVYIRVWRIVEGKGEDRVTKAMAPMMVAEGHEFCLVRVHAESTASHPVSDSVKVRYDEVYSGV
jgi:hypothetical protein